MDGTPYKCDSGVVVNIEEVAIEDSFVAVTDGIVWDVDSTIVKCPNKFPNESTGV